MKECVQKYQERVIPGGPVVNSSSSKAGRADSIPVRGAKTPHSSGAKNQNIKQKWYCNKFNKDFRNGPHQKIFLKIIPGEEDVKGPFAQTGVWNGEIYQIVTVFEC